MADFAKNLQELALANGSSLPLAEAYLGIAEMHFLGGPHEGPKFAASPENKASRFFIEVIARTVYTSGQPTFLTDLGRFRTAAAEFFAQHWTDRPGTGAHPILDALRNYQQVVITWKVDARPREVLRLEDLLRLARCA